MISHYIHFISFGLIFSRSTPEAGIYNLTHTGLQTIRGCEQDGHHVHSSSIYQVSIFSNKFNRVIHNFKIHCPNQHFQFWMQSKFCWSPLIPTIHIYHKMFRKKKSSMLHGLELISTLAELVTVPLKNSSAFTHLISRFHFNSANCKQNYSSALKF